VQAVLVVMHEHKAQVALILFLEVLHLLEAVVVQRVLQLML
jgi:hypothetical protein